MDESSLYWNQMPEYLYIHKDMQTMPGHMGIKERVILLLGSNAIRYKLEIFLIYYSEKPHGFQSIKKIHATHSLLTIEWFESFKFSLKTYFQNALFQI